MGRNDITIFLMVVFLFWFNIPKTSATIIYNDGEVHIIDSAIEEWIDVYDSPTGEITTVNVIGDAWIYGLETFDNSQVNITGGDYVGELYLHDNSRGIVSDDGTLGLGGFTYDTSRLDISSENLWCTWAWAYDNSLINISAGHVSMPYSEESSQINISGGYVDYARAEDYSQMNISGGHFVDIQPNVFDTRMIISGGTFGGNVEFETASVYPFIIIGLKGYYPGNPDPCSPFNYPLGEIPDSSGTLTGTLLSGETINMDFEIYEGGSIILAVSLPPEYCDFDDSGHVDFNDFAVLALQWQQMPGKPSADIAPLDGFVDINDLTYFLEECWLWIE